MIFIDLRLIDFCNILQKFDKTNHINYKVGNMLEVLFGSKNRERVLQFVLANENGYSKKIEKLTMQRKRPRRAGKPF
jgi:hypothetical protein